MAVSRTVKSFDGTRIHYRTEGEGPVMCACNGIGVSTFFWNYLVKYFSKSHRVIVWDYRFHGKSGPGPDYDGLTMETNARDLLAVLDDAKADKAVLLGHSMGVQTILEFYRQNPDRCAALIPVLGAYGRPLDTFLGTDIFKYLFAFGFYPMFLFPGAAQKAVRTGLKVLFSDYVAWPGARLTGLVNFQHIRKKDLHLYLDHLKTLDLRAFMAMAKHMQEHSARAILPEIKVPVLVIAGEDDLFTPLEISKDMHGMIPNSELLVIPRGSHAALVEQPELMNLRIEKFLRERVENPCTPHKKSKKPRVKGK
ncbi:alpha/beta hydrolase fold protein [Desulfatibacillum aliphaticivorans]|uniref:Alpha/beta hydrolase fold protein n=1 Tax=Desulfatibacillum aliphaticivorans TaxID=218208 RepID=B8FG90_DESAL|nr:alpha/beta hydrolase [Desulfatibacillum aliphaticivorans]ACL03770.1 alpha/beta hydrolase fold protein [Desulfatibacillum aliphaticivorans]